MDLVEGQDNDVFVYVADFFLTFEERAVHFSMSLEEFFEMAGATTFLYIFLMKLTSLTPSIKSELNPDDSG